MKGTIVGIIGTLKKCTIVDIVVIIIIVGIVGIINSTIFGICSGVRVNDWWTVGATRLMSWAGQWFLGMDVSPGGL